MTAASGDAWLKSGVKATDDYYNCSYVPTQLTDRWKALRAALDDDDMAHLQRLAEPHSFDVVAVANAAGQPAELHSPKRRVSSLDFRPRSSLVLNQYYEDRKEARDVSVYQFQSEQQEELSSSSDESEGSAYRRHHRFDDPSTAYQQVSDPYGRAEEIAKQQRFIEESKRLAKPFVPSGGSALSKPTRLMLGDCVRSLFRSIASDWREAEPMVVSTSEDLIVVFFSLHALKKRQATVVLNYMNKSLMCSAAVREYDLSKVPECWDVLTDDGHLLYALRPPWVKRKTFLPDTILPPTAHVPAGKR